jgi:hypothetical protein
MIQTQDLKLSDNIFAAYWHHERRAHLSICMMLYDKSHGNNGLWVGFIKQRNQDMTTKSGVEVDQNKEITRYFGGVQECEKFSLNCLDHAIVDGFYKPEPI